MITKSNYKNILLSLVGALRILLSNASFGQKLQPLEFFKLPGDIISAEDVSAITKINSFLVIGSDEGDGEDKNYIQLLKKRSDKSYAIHNNILLFKDNKEDGKEMDIEGLAAAGNKIYVVGSHSSKRKKINKDKKYKKNREKFHASNIEDETNRGWLYRLTIDAQGNEVSRDKITLREIIKNAPDLKAFRNIPSKENGVDMEGLSVKDGWLYTLHVQEYPIHSTSLMAHGVVAKPFNRITIVAPLRLAMHHYFVKTMSRL